MGANLSPGGSGTYCGDGSCSDASRSSCPVDCGTCAYCDNGVCESGETPEVGTPGACYEDCTACGDGVCSPGENEFSCPSDCLDQHGSVLERPRHDGDGRKDCDDLTLRRPQLPRGLSTMDGSMGMHE